MKRSHFRRLVILLSPFSLLLSPVARSATFDLSTATLADINAAFDAGALSSEKLVALYLARIAAYDQRGPMINCVVSVDPQATLAEASALDAERKSKGPRSPLHGVPVILKDNIDSVGLPNTGGSFLLEGNMPAEDAFVVKSLRRAGAIILAKVNLGDFATTGTGFSSIIGQSRNPHNLSYSPAGSSGGTGAGLGAWFAPLGLGTDTGGSTRSPTSVNGVVGLKPTHGLLSRTGVIPCIYTFDTVGPMARSVSDLAALIGAMTGLDPQDPQTSKGAGLYHTDYRKFLKKDALKGVRLGVNRNLKGIEPEVDAIFEAALADLKKLGATLVDAVNYPPLVLQASGAIMKVVGDSEVREQYEALFATLKQPGVPKKLEDMITRSAAFTAPHGRVTPYPAAYVAFKDRVDGPPSSTLGYHAAKEHGVAMMRETVLGLYERHQLDAIVYCTRPNKPDRIDPKAATDRPTPSPTPVSIRSVGNITGFPDLIVPAGVTSEKLPISISFIGPAYSEPRLLAYAYAYEQATQKRVLPAHTPPLPGERFDY